jgi:SAM-dependent methyltransferase
VTHYDAKFYKSFRDMTYRSAREVIPLILRLMPVGSVCDVGCGDGTWLRAFREVGVTDVLGIDGEYITKNLLQIPAANFRAMDLRKRISLQRSFDLAISLEVAEHLPESCAARFVEDLTRLAPVILLSAAIPGQGGRDHVNEQWQTYWTAMFAQCGYIVCDFLRPKIWRDRRIAYWYRQNALLFCSESSLETIPELALSPHSLRASLVHPEQMDFPDALRAAVIVAPKYAKNCLKRIPKMEAAVHVVKRVLNR